MKAIEQSHLDARFATPESTLTVPNTTLGNSNFEKLHLKFSKKRYSHLENYKNWSSVFNGNNRNLSKYTTTGLEVSLKLIIL